jgi:hypothetical protein
VRCYAHSHVQTGTAVTLLPVVSTPRPNEHAHTLHMAYKVVGEREGCETGVVCLYGRQQIFLRMSH